MPNTKNPFKAPKPRGEGYRNYSRLNNAYQMHLDASHIEKPRTLDQSNISEMIEIRENWKMPDDRPYYINVYAGIGTSDETAGLNNWKRMIDEPAQGSAAWSHQEHPIANANAGITMILKEFDQMFDGVNAFANGEFVSEAASSCMNKYMSIAAKNPGGLTKKQKKNLMRKMKKFAANQQLPGQQGAQKLASDQPEKKVGAVKRPMPDDPVPPSVPNKNPEKRQKMDIQPNLQSTPSQTIKMTLAKVGFPIAKLSKKEANLILQEILKKSDKIPEDGQLPKILECRSSFGAITVQCEDTATVKWLTSNFHDNDSILSGETISVLGASELPKSIIVSFRTQDIFTKESKALLKRLNRLNPKLKCMEWQTLHHTVEPPHCTWIFEVDPEGFEHINEAQCKAYTGVDRGVFSILWRPKGNAEEIKDEEVEGKEIEDKMVQIEKRN